MRENKIDLNFEKLYSEYYGKVYNYVVGCVSKVEITEDIVADIFIKAIIKQHTFDETKAQFSTWIMTIAHNTVIDYYRNNQKATACNVKLLSEMLDDTGVEAVIQAQENKKMLFKAIKQMKDAEKKVLSLRYFYDMSYRQIAEIVGYTEGYVGVVLNRSVKKLKKKMSERRE